MSVVGIGGAAYASIDKSVTLTVDGRSRTVHSFGTNVGDVLADARVEVGHRDVVAPDPSTAIRDGSEISVRHARQLTVTVDGEKSTRWVTALNVGAALDQLDVRTRGAKLSTARSVGIGRSGGSVEVRTPKQLTVLHDGKKERLNQPVLTVGEALSTAHVRFDANDRIQPKLGGFVEDGTTIRVQRVEKRVRKVDHEMPYETVRKADDSLYEGDSEVTREGRPGLERRVVRVTYVDGKQTGRKILDRTVVREAVDEVVAYGTKDSPGPNLGGDVDDLNWEALAECESGGDPRAVNPSGYYGLYQFALSTWESVGGSGNPIDASPSEQTYRAKLLYNKSGAGQWACGSHLYD